jgi:hypothetical protein
MRTTSRYRSTLRAAGGLACVTIAGCMTAQTYEGEQRPADEIAHIAGDLVVTAGAPLSLILRKVDEQTLSVGQSAVEVLPGTHTLLVDCRIQETQGVSRHSIEVEVFAGGRYRLVADTGPGLRECTAVRVERSN